MIKFNSSDLDFALSNYSIDMTVLALFIAMKRYYPNDVELARNVATDIFNCYMNLPTKFFPAIVFDEVIYIDAPKG